MPNHRHQVDVDLDLLRLRHPDPPCVSAPPRRASAVRVVTRYLPVNGPAVWRNNRWEKPEGGPADVDHRAPAARAADHFTNKIDGLLQQRQPGESMIDFRHRIGTLNGRAESRYERRG